VVGKAIDNQKIPLKAKKLLVLIALTHDKLKTGQSGPDRFDFIGKFFFFFGEFDNGADYIEKVHEFIWRFWIEKWVILRVFEDLRMVWLGKLFESVKGEREKKS